MTRVRWVRHCCGGVPLEITAFRCTPVQKQFDCRTALWMRGNERTGEAMSVEGHANSPSVSKQDGMRYPTCSSPKAPAWLCGQWVCITIVVIVGTRVSKVRSCVLRLRPEPWLSERASKAISKYELRAGTCPCLPSLPVATAVAFCRQDLDCGLQSRIFNSKMMHVADAL